MRQKTIAELHRLFKLDQLTKKDIQTLKTDPRVGVQRIITSFQKEQAEQQKLEENFKEMTTYERTLQAQGYEYIAGVDEAGRGPLAGPVVAAAVILPYGFKLLGLNDSKILTKTKLLQFYEVIKQQAISYGVAMVDNKQIDRVNIFEATKQAMNNALSYLQTEPSYALIDAVDLNHLPFPSDVIIKGDQKSISIAAASVIAKVTRDKLMKEIHQQYPMYHFHTNMGYGTKHHLNMLKKHGLSPVHRRSYTPVKRSMK